MWQVNSQTSVAKHSRSSFLLPINISSWTEGRLCSTESCRAPGCRSSAVFTLDITIQPADRGREGGGLGWRLCGPALEVACTTCTHGPLTRMQPYGHSLLQGRLGVQSSCVPRRKGKEVWRTVRSSRSIQIDQFSLFS